MQGIYYQTLFRNQETGDTEFYIIPDEKIPELRDGCLLCKGKIGIYAKGTPIVVEGNMESGSLCVEKCYIPYKTAENVRRLLEYLFDELTETQIGEIIKASNCDLFSFIERYDCEEILMGIFSRSKNGGQKTKKLIAKIKMLKGKETLVAELMKYEIPIDRIEALYKKNVSLSEIDKNPYLTLLHSGVKMDKVEAFAFRNGDIGAYSMVRLKGFVYEAMKYIVDGGSTCTTLPGLTRVVNNRLKSFGVVETDVDCSIVNLCINEMPNICQYEIVNGNPLIYLNYVITEENKAVNNLIRLGKNQKRYKNLASIEDIEKKLGITYNEKQKETFKAVESSGVKILTGPPGSGKTAVIKGLIEHFGTNGKVRLAATTGMAARVMSKACDMPVETVNSMLHVLPFEDGLQGKNLNDPVDADLIIVDEVSMLGLKLFSVLTEAVKSGSILLLVGDEDQLQSVDYGNVLHDLIGSERFEVYRLTEVLRQSGTICENAFHINKGELSLSKDDTFWVKSYETDEEAVEDLLKNVDLGKSQILTPIKAGVLGTEAINEKYVHDGDPVIVYGKKNFHVGDKVIMTKNNYQSNYINGEIGYVDGAEDEQIIIRFNEKVLHIGRQDMGDIEFAYAITIHKSQGSEFEDVHILLPQNAKHMMTRRLLYTAVTRGKKRVFIYNVDNALPMAISNHKETSRMSTINEKIVMREK